MLRDTLGRDSIQQTASQSKKQNLLTLRTFNSTFALVIANTRPTPYSSKSDFIMANTGIYKSKECLESAWSAYLAKQNLLTLRTLNPTFALGVAYTRPTPYSSKSDFIMANTGIYKTKECLESAWSVYSRVAASTSTLPAILYALDERKFLDENIFPSLTCQGENLRETGRRYLPPIHNWDTNAAWMQIHVHKRNRFTLISDYPSSNHFYKKGNGYSALTNEITFALKSGYYVSEIHYIHNRNIIVFSPDEVTTASLPLDAYRFHTDDYINTCVVMSETQIHGYIQLGKEIAKEINELFSNFENIQNDLIKLKFARFKLFELLDKLKFSEAIQGFIVNFDLTIINIGKRSKLKNMNDIRDALIIKIQNAIDQLKLNKACKQTASIDKNSIFTLKIEKNKFINDKIQKDFLFKNTDNINNDDTINNNININGMI